MYTPEQMDAFRDMFRALPDWLPALADQLDALVKASGGYDVAQKMVLAYLTACELDDMGELFPEGEG